MNHINKFEFFLADGKMNKNIVFYESEQGAIRVKALEQIFWPEIHIPNKVFTKTYSNIKKK